MVPFSSNGLASLSKGPLGDTEVFSLVTGVGLERAARAIRWAADLARPRLLISSGCAGGLVTGLSAGELVIASEVVTLDGKRRPISEGWGKRYLRAAERAGVRVRQGALLTSASVLPDGAAKRRAAEQTGATAVEMEAAAIADWASAAGVELAASRVIIDPLEMAMPAEAMTVTDESGRVRVGALLAAVARRPGLARQLLAVGAAARTCRQSLAKVHAALLGGLE